MLSAACDWEMFTVLAEDMKSDGGRVEIVRVTGVVPCLVPRHSVHAQSRAGGGWRILDLDDTGARHQLPIVLPHNEPGADDGGADDALQLKGAELPHVNIGPSEYPNLKKRLIIH